MLTPASLKPNDKIRLVAPAGKVRMNHVKAAVEVLRSAGYSVTEGAHLYDQHHQYAGDDQARRADLQEALDDDACRAILMARGGYGLIRIIDGIDFSRFLKNPKWIAGFSDVTALHNHLHNRGVETIHSVMPNSFPVDGNPSHPVTLLLQTLTGNPPLYSVDPHPFNRHGRSSGRLTGGNLTMVTAMLGSVSETDTHGKTLLLEDVGEHHYRIDRMMHMLKRAGKLSGLAGLVVGQFNDLNDSSDHFGKEVTEIIMEAVADYNYPVMFGFPAGHEPDNRPLILGRTTLLHVESTTVKIDQTEIEHG